MKIVCQFWDDWWEVDEKRKYKFLLKNKKKYSDIAIGTHPQDSGSKPGAEKFFEWLELNLNGYHHVLRLHLIQVVHYWYALSVREKETNNELARKE